MSTALANFGGSVRKRFVALSLIAGLALLASGCDWTSFRGGPARTGFDAFETPQVHAKLCQLSPSTPGACNTLISTTNASSATLKWAKAVGLGGRESSPVVADGKVFVNSDDGNLYALDA